MMRFKNSALVASKQIELDFARNGGLQGVRCYTRVGRIYTSMKADQNF